jgi:hypothetical protein
MDVDCAADVGAAAVAGDAAKAAAVVVVVTVAAGACGRARALDRVLDGAGDDGDAVVFAARGTLGVAIGAASWRLISQPTISRVDNRCASACARTTPASVPSSVMASAA